MTNVQELNNELTGNRGENNRVNTREAERTIVAINKEMATLYAKMARVMNLIAPIEKTGYNDYHKYPYQTAGAIANAVRTALASEGIAFFFDTVDIDQSVKGRTKATFDFTLACGDTGATLTKRYSGEALDNADKGINKALTAAVKYFLMKTFLISPPDEPDADSGEDAQEDPKPKSKGRKPANTTSNTPANTESPAANPYVLNDVINDTVFMYQARNHAINSINGMIDRGEIAPDDTHIAAIWKVFEHRAKSDPYKMEMAQVYEALTDARDSNVPVASIKQWVKDGGTLESAWQAVVEYHANKNLKPATPKNDNESAQADTPTPEDENVIPF